MLSTPPPPTLPTGSPRQQNNLRRSDLAGWRTRSLFQPASLSTESSDHPMFLPVLKLRGLPYYCSKKHLMTWFDSLAKHVLDMLFVADVEPLNTGFALVTMDSPRAAVQAWLSLHKKPMIGKRFVEVFALFPPCCPLYRRGTTVADPSTASGLIPLPADAVAIQQKHLSGSPSTVVDCAVGICSFCGFALSAHGDGGRAAVATSRAWELMVKAPRELRLHGLMHSGFLGIPALLYQDGGAVSRAEVELFNPGDWNQRRRQNAPTECSLYLQAKLGPERVLTLRELRRLVEGSATKHPPPLDIPNPAGAAAGEEDEFFDLMSLGVYDIRAFLCEAVQVLLDNARPSPCATHWTGGLSIAEIGNLLSPRARAYLFVTEIKLRNVLESFPHLFHVARATAQFEFSSVTLRPDVVGLSIQPVIRMEAFELTKRRKAAGKQNAVRARVDGCDKTGRRRLAAEVVTAAPRYNTPPAIPPPPVRRSFTHNVDDPPHELPVLSPLHAAQQAALSAIPESYVDDFQRAASYAAGLWPREEHPLGEWSNTIEASPPPVDAFPLLRTELSRPPPRLPTLPASRRPWVVGLEPPQVDFIDVPLANFVPVYSDNRPPPPMEPDPGLTQTVDSHGFPPVKAAGSLLLDLPPPPPPLLAESDEVSLLGTDTLWIPDELEGLSLNHRATTCPPATSYGVGSWYLNQNQMQSLTDSTRGWIPHELLAYLTRSTTTQGITLPPHLRPSTSADLVAGSPALGTFADEIPTADALDEAANMDGVSIVDANLLLQVAQQLLSTYNEEPSQTENHGNGCMT